MKVLEEIKVSVYENVYSKKPKVMSFLEVIIVFILFMQRLSTPSVDIMQMEIMLPHRN